MFVATWLNEQSVIIVPRIKLIRYVSLCSQVKGNEWELSVGGHTFFQLQAGSDLQERDGSRKSLLYSLRDNIR